MMPPDEELVAKALNNAGWTCEYGADEPGKYDDCAYCQRVCNRMANAVLEALTTAGRLIPEGAEVQYGHAYHVIDGLERGERYGSGKDRYVRPVTKAVWDARLPDGHYADGRVYWNYIQVMRMKATPWREVQGDE